MPTRSAFVRNIRESCLERLILLANNPCEPPFESSWGTTILERNHQGLNNRLIQPYPTISSTQVPVQRKQRPSGNLNYYRAGA
jgi:hypothetical protein